MRTTYDGLIHGAADAHGRWDYTPMLGLADHLDERGLPGANLLKASYAAKVERRESATPQLLYTTTAPGDDRPHTTEDGKLRVRVEASSTDLNGEHVVPVLHVTHFPEGPHEPVYFTHYVRVHSRDHLRNLIAGLPRKMALRVASEVIQHFPAVSSTGPVKLAAIEAPGAPGQSVIVKVPVPQPVGGQSDTPAPAAPINPETPKPAPSAPAARGPVWILPQ